LPQLGFLEPDLSGVSAVILAGGSGERLGEYKPLFKLLGRPMVLYVYEAAGRVADEVILAVKTHDQAEALARVVDNARIVFDVVDLGAVGGIYAGLVNAHYDLVLVLPSDTPLLSSETLTRLLKHVGKHEAAVPRWPNGYIEPLVAAVRRGSALSAVQRLVELGIASSRELYKLLDTVYVDVYTLTPNPEAEFFNVNTYEDAVRAEELLRRYTST